MTGLSPESADGSSSYGHDRTGFSYVFSLAFQGVNVIFYKPNQQGRMFCAY